MYDGMYDHGNSLVTLIQMYDGMYDRGNCLVT